MNNFNDIDLDLYKLLVEATHEGRTGLMRGYNSVTGEDCSVVCVLYETEEGDTAYIPIGQLYTNINPKEIYSPKNSMSIH